MLTQKLLQFQYSYRGSIQVFIQNIGRVTIQLWYWLFKNAHFTNITWYLLKLNALKVTLTKASATQM